MKRGKLSKREMDYIVKYANLKTNKEMSLRLKRTEEHIQRFKEQQGLAKPSVRESKIFPVKEAFGRSKQAIVATPAMSELSDDIKTKRGDTKCIFRINPLKK